MQRILTKRMAKMNRRRERPFSASLAMLTWRNVLDEMSERNLTKTRTDPRMYAILLQDVLGVEFCF